MTRVLVVEDEESFSDALSYMLRREGFDAVVAGTGPDALAEFDRGGADIVLLDLMLPGLPGTEVCRALRSRSNVPIIMLTAKDGEIDKVVGLELGADDYVTKPYSARELVARIRAVLRRRGDAAEHVRQRIGERLLVLDHQHAGHSRPLPATRCAPVSVLGPSASAAGSSGARGMRRVKVDPSPSSLHTLTEPPWLLATCLTMARPRPVPPVLLARDWSTR
jgi:CheY-like chemotaxis protein